MIHSEILPGNALRSAFGASSHISDDRAEALRRARNARFAKLVDQFERDEIEAAVDGLIALLDAGDGDPDLEDDNCGEPDGDSLGDVAWTEWDTRGQHKLQRKPHLANGHEPSFGRTGWQVQEDDEEDDFAEDDDPAEDADSDYCTAHDDGCGMILRNGEILWGSEQDDQISLPTGDYGLDQSLGPLTRSGRPREGYAAANDR